MSEPAAHRNPGNPGNLPAELASFVGRRAEIAEVRRSLEVSRLVTLTGAGGVGKTRLALRVARELRRNLRDGVWLVELSELQDAQLLGHTVAAALQLQDASKRPQIEVLVEHLAERSLLLILDTCEHLLDECAILVEILLAACPGLRVLATSRQPLSVPGERVLAVRPLPVPEQGASADAVAGSHAVILFAERAAARDPGFTLTSHNAPAVAALCRRLEGIPLAIELAAGRLRGLTVEQLGERLHDRLDVLGGRGGTPSRHQTLRTTIGWSHELCEPLERLLWARLSAFPGSFDLTAAEQVSADEQLPRVAVPMVLAELVDKSIVMREQDGDSPRFRMLDTVREYGLEWLHALGEEEDVRRRHRDHFLRLARQGEAEWYGPDQLGWCRRMTQEQPSLRAALDFCLTTPDERRAGLELAGRLWFMWWCCGFVREGRHYLDLALDLDAEPSAERVEAEWARAVVAYAQGDVEAMTAALAYFGAMASHKDDLLAQARVFYLRGILAPSMAHAAPLFRKAADRFREVGALLWCASSLVGVTTALALSGDFDEAIAAHEEQAVLCRDRGELWSRSFGDYARGLAEVGRGAVDAGMAHLRSALEVKHRMRDALGMALTLDALAAAEVAAGRPARAARLLGAAQQTWTAFGLSQRTLPGFVAARERTEQAVRRGIGEDAYAAAFQEGRDQELDDAIGYALGRRRERAAPKRAASQDPLTPREREIAELVALGMTNRQIAERLVIGKRTVDAHVQSILAKLGFNSRVQIAGWLAGCDGEPVPD